MNQTFQDKNCTQHAQVNLIRDKNDKILFENEQLIKYAGSYSSTFPTI